MEQKLVSVVVPAFNAQDELPRCLESLLRQSYQNIEILVIDDGSSDNTYIVAKEIACNEERIKVIKQQENAGVSVARNLGIENAKGEYLTFVDADDSVREDFVEKMVEHIKQYDLVICGYNRVNEKVIPILLGKTGEITREEYFQYTFVDKIVTGSCCNKLFHMDIVRDRKVCFPTGIIVNEDRVFCMSYYQYCKNTFYISEALYQYYYNEVSCTHLKYRNKVFDTRQAAFLDSMEMIENMYQDEPEYMKACMTYKKMRYCVNLMFQMIVCNTYNKEVVNRIMEIIRKKNSLRISYEFGDKIICMALLGIYLSPRMVYMGGKIMYRIFRRQIDNYLD